MLTAETLYQRAKTLDAATLQEVGDFLEFLVNKKNLEFLQAQKRRYFPATSLETVEPPALGTRVLSLEEMDAVIELEASQSHDRD
ncbi:MAG: hypothetical protein WAQ53_10600 [Thiofilum sp.]|uniref:hypothetical protein n=1 Tax=Thiofilum sp. TaxID=2212733 RepID=UPI0025EF292C|nr:hypothetical protein [Thiofilum sp.]MBK8453310.1 hypothetical protein [Thiofilum sp.]